MSQPPREGGISFEQAGIDPASGPAGHPLDRRGRSKYRVPRIVSWAAILALAAIVIGFARLAGKDNPAQRAREQGLRAAKAGIDPCANPHARGTFNGPLGEAWLDGYLEGIAPHQVGKEPVGEDTGASPK